MAVDYPDVVLYSLIPLRPRGVIVLHGDVAWKSVLEETLHRQVVDDVEIIVEIHKVLAQTGNVVHISLYHHRIEGGEELRGNEIGVAHYVELGIGGIEPLGRAAVHYEVNLAHPGSKLLHTAEPVAQEAVVSEAGFRHSVAGVVLVVAVTGELLQPLRVVHIHPCYYEIYIHASLLLLSWLLKKAIWSLPAAVDGVLEAVVRPQVKLGVLPYLGFKPLIVEPRKHKVGQRFRFGVQKSE